MTFKVRNIGIIGYGNVGSHLSRVFSEVEALTLTIYNRSRIETNKLPRDVKFSHDLTALSTSELIIIAVRDDAIPSVLHQMESRITPDTLVCHCSGSVPSTVIQPYFDRYGVLYPLQTFTKEKEIDYPKIPVFITGSDSEVIQQLENVGRHISSNIRQIEDNQRLALHIAAVFCCNYSNAMYAIGERICNAHNLEFKDMLPLIKETAEKVNVLSPQIAQTGPALRGDRELINKHESYLSTYDNQIATLYRQLADYININL